MINDPNFFINNDNTITKRTASGEIRNKIFHTKHDGYKQVKYMYQYLQVHRVMYRKFIGPLLPGLVINHKDGDKTNNRPENLEQTTSSKNMQHSFDILGRLPPTKKKLTFEQAQQIRIEKSNGAKTIDLSRTYNVSRGTIKDIVYMRSYLKAS